MRRAGAEDQRHPANQVGFPSNPVPNRSVLLLCVLNSAPSPCRPPRSLEDSPSQSPKVPPPQPPAASSSKGEAPSADARRRSPNADVLDVTCGVFSSAFSQTNRRTLWPTPSSSCSTTTSAFTSRTSASNPKSRQWRRTSRSVAKGELERFCTS